MNYLIGSLSAVIILLLLYLYLKLKFKEFRINKKIKAQLKRGIKKEEEAKKFLIKNGYKIVSHNQNFSYYIKEDDSKIKITIETDYIVYKNNKKYIVEVKSGSESPKITNRNTRRQILEYYSFIDNDGILLLNMENKRIAEIKFPNKITNKHSVVYILVAIIEFLIIAILVTYIFSL